MLYNEVSRTSLLRTAASLHNHKLVTRRQTVISEMANHAFRMIFVSEDADWDQTEMFGHDCNEHLVLFFFQNLGGFGVALTEVLLHMVCMAIDLTIRAEFHAQSRRASGTRTQKKLERTLLKCSFDTLQDPEDLVG